MIEKETRPARHDYIDPMRPTLLTERPPLQKDWACEASFSGIRTTVYIYRGGSVAMYTQNRHDLMHQFPNLLQALSILGKKHNLTLDGVIVVGAGREGDIKAAQFRIRHPRRPEPTPPAQFVAFDLLYKDDQDLTNMPLTQRRWRLRRVIPRELAQKNIVVNPLVDANRPEELLALIKFATQNKLEGVVFKKKNSRYKPGRRSDDWKIMRFPKSQPNTSI